MKENGIMVDFEWAYKEVMLSNDFTGKSPAWINNFVEGWRKGYLKGFLRGWTEGAIEVICAMKRAGFSSEMIAKCTDISIDVVEMVTEAKE